MRGRPKKKPRQKDLARDYLHATDGDDDLLDRAQRFSKRHKHQQENKTLRTTLQRAAEAAESELPDAQTLPVGTVRQVYSLYSEVEHDGRTYLAVMRKTLSKTSDTAQVVGDQVRFRPVDDKEAVIEEIQPRQTVLTRADSFKGVVQHPIVANARQMLIVVSLRMPDVKWGLVDRMIVAARSGGLVPIVCLNKADLAHDPPESIDLEAVQVLEHFQSLGIRSLRTSAEANMGLDELRTLLKDQTTVLAGHSGVGKSSLIRAIQPQLDLRVGEVSGYTNKGRHTTTSARSYPLDFGGIVIDTPGVKLFGLWNVTPDNLSDYFPDVAAGTAPPWRQESFGRIRESLSR